MPPPVAPVPSAPGQVPPAPLFTPVAFEVLPGWQQDDLRQAWPAFMASCRALAARPDWKAPCAAAKTGRCRRRRRDPPVFRDLVCAEHGARG
jgi:membrane-bound lytic murein transglycosylase A